MHSSLLHLGKRPHKSADDTPGESQAPSTGSNTDSTGPSTVSSPPTAVNGPNPKGDDPMPACRLGFRLESGPLVMYGPATESTGCLLSGILDLEVLQDTPLEVREASMSIVQEVRLSNSATLNAYPGPRVVNELVAKWNVLEHPQNFSKAIYGYPFSHLLPGSLPPSMRAPLFTIAYHLEAVVYPADASNQPYRVRLDLTIGRSVTSIVDKTSVRVFPPTDMSVNMDLPSAVFPQGTIRAELRIQNIVAVDEEAPSRIKRWRPKRIQWTFYETTTIVPPAAANAAPASPITQKVSLANGYFKSGWKTDFAHKGLVEFVNGDFAPGALQFACKDVNDPVLGITVEHCLSVEIIIAEEIVANRQVKHGILTGNARVLRTTFRVAVMDRPGLGISWDDEVPPTYADVPLSPPTYDKAGHQASFEDLQNIIFSPALSPAIAPAPSPTLRHLDPTLPGPEPTPTSFLQSIAKLKLAGKFSKRGDEPLSLNALDSLRPFQSAPPK